MKQLTLKALFLSGVAAFSMNVHASSVYEQCVSDAKTLIEAAIVGGTPAAREVQQKSTVDQCRAELTRMEQQYKSQWKFTAADGKQYVKAPYSVMTPEDREKWAILFNAIDTKNFMGVRYLMAAYYRQ